MTKKITEYITRDFSAIDKQLKEISKREVILTRRLRIGNLKHWLFLSIPASLGLGIFALFLSIAYRIAFP